MKKGVTLIEIMFVSAIIIVVGWLAFNLLSSGTITWHSGLASLTVQQELRRGLHSMVKELEQTSATVIDSFTNNVPANGLDYNSIILRIPQDINGDGTILDSNGQVEWSTPIAYQLIFNAQLNSFQLIRTQDAATTVLANYLPTQLSAQFKRNAATPNIIEITLRGQKSSSLGHISSGTIGGRVEMRN